MITDEEIDEALLANITVEWCKVARVVDSAMSQLGNRRAGRNDLYFAERVALLAKRGLIEYQGDLAQMDRCEIRLPQQKKDT
jgi:hypothetical protein